MAAAATTPPSLDGYLKYTETGLNGLAKVTELISKTFDKFEDLVKQRLSEKHLEKWTELTDLRLQVRTDSYMCAKNLKVRVVECEDIVESAKCKDDIKSVVKFLENKAIKKELTTLRDDCVKLTGLLVAFKRILDTHYKNCKSYMKIAAGIGLVIIGVGLLASIFFPPAAIALEVASPLAIKVASGVVGSVSIVGGVYMLTEKDQIEQLKHQLEKDKEISEKTSKYLMDILSTFQDLPDVSSIKKLISRRLNIIHVACENLISKIYK